MVHLICGLPGSGKTTFAKTLAEREGAVRFSIDEWISKLFVSNCAPQWEMPINEATQATYRCFSIIWPMSKQLLRRGVPVVLDTALFLKKHRLSVAQLAEEVGVRSKLHYVKADLEICRRRVRERNQNVQPNMDFMFVSDERFDFFAHRFEQPDPMSEPHEVVQGTGSR
jgi:predicted kinase